MSRRMLFSLLAAMLFIFVARVIADDAEPLERGKSPDGQLQVVNIRNGAGGYFEVRTSMGEVLFSEKTLTDHYPVPPKGAQQVLWSANSQWVAIAFGTTKFSVETIVLHRNGSTLELVGLPIYDQDSDNTHRIPQEWRKNGDLVLAVSSGYHTKSDGEIDQYLATVQFKGTPPKGEKGPQTKPTALDEGN